MRVRACVELHMRVLRGHELCKCSSCESHYFINFDWVVMPHSTVLHIRNSLAEATQTLIQEEPLVYIPFHSQTYYFSPEHNLIQCHVAQLSAVFLSCLYASAGKNEQHIMERW